MFSNDAIKLYYTPTLRKQTVHATLPIYIGSGPPNLYLKPGKERAFLTRTCKVGC